MTVLSNGWSPAWGMPMGNEVRSFSMNRLDELSGCPLYRRLAPRKWIEGVIIVGCAIMLPVIAVLQILSIYEVYFAPDAAPDWKSFPLMLLGVPATAAIMVWFALEDVRKLREINNGRTQQLARLDMQQLLALQEEIETAELRYRTFYLLREYVYVPKARLLVRYEDIAGWETVPNTRHLRLTAKITERDGTVHVIGLRQQRAYWQEYDSFRELLDSYRQRANGR